MSEWKEWRDAEPVERSGRDEWPVCCNWRDTKLCHCDETDVDEPKPQRLNLNDPPPRWIEPWEVV